MAPSTIRIGAWRITGQRLRQGLGVCALLALLAALPFACNRSQSREEILGTLIDTYNNAQADRVKLGRLIQTNKELRKVNKGDSMLLLRNEASYAELSTRMEYLQLRIDSLIRSSTSAQDNVQRLARGTKEIMANYEANQAQTARLVRAMMDNAQMRTLIQNDSNLSRLLDSLQMRTARPTGS